MKNKKFWVSLMAGIMAAIMMLMMMAVRKVEIRNQGGRED